MNNQAIENIEPDLPEQPVIDKAAIYETVYQHFKDQVEAQAPKKLSNVTADIALLDIGIDSLECLEVVMNLEECYEVFVPDNKIEEFTTIQSVVDYLVVAIAAKAEVVDDNQPEPD